MSDASRTPPLSEVLDRLRSNAVAEVRVSVPAKVVRYDASKRQCDAQPLVKEAYTDEDGDRQVMDLPVCVNCPVQFPSGGGLSITYPLTVGDTGMLVFSDVSLDLWLAKGGTVDPVDDHRHSLSDAVFIPGVFPFVSAPAGSATGIQIGTDGATLEGVALGNALATFIGSLAPVPSGLMMWLAGLAALVGYTETPPVVPSIESATVKVTS